MPQINCYIPIKLRITGRPTDQQLDQLAETLVRTLTARIAFAERTINARRLASESWTAGKVRERSEESPFHKVGYEVPAHSHGGKRKQLPVRRSTGPLRVKGLNTDENVYRFLRKLKQRLSRFRNVILGRIKGNILEYGEKRYRLLTSTPLAEVDTVSSRLGEGVFFLQPIPREGLGVVALMAGAAFEIQRVDSQGGLHGTNIKVIVAGLGSIAEGILIYSARRLYFAETRIEARQPRDTAALAQRIIKILDELGIIASPVHTVLAILANLESENLTHEEVMDILYRLDRAGRLGEFLNLVRLPRFRQFLKEKGVSWDYIYRNWEPSINDSGLFFAGYLIGAGQSVYDGLRLIGILIGSIFSEEMAKERHKLWTAMKQFFAHPIINSISGLKLLRDTFTEALWNLDFFEAGRIAGNVVVVILTLPEAIQALPKAARGLVKMAGKVGRLTLRAVEELGVSIRTLAQFVRQPAPRLVLNNGMTLMKAGDEIIVLDRSGNAAGRVVPREFTPAEIAEWERTFKEPGAAPPLESPVTMLPAFLDLEDLVRQAIGRLRAQLGRTWLPSRHFGTRLHKALEEIITASGQSPKGWRIFAEQTMREIANIPDTIANLTLKEYLATRPHLQEFLKIPEEMLKSKIGDLRPDLVIFEPGKAAVIWDLTSQSALEHLAKTQLYAHILQDVSDLGLVRWGETYWKLLKGQPSAAAAIPATGAAPKVESQKQQQ